MRLAAAVLLVAALAACGGSKHGSTPPGKPVGSACAAAAECQPGLLCFRNACASSLPAAASCAPPGSPRIVLGDPVVAPEPPAGTCVTPVRDPVLSGGEVQDLGELAAGTQAQFQIPDGTASFTIVSQEIPGTGVADVTFQGVKVPNSVVPTDVLLPDGRVFFDDLAQYPVVGGYDDVTGLLAYYGGATPISGAFGAPDTSAALDLVLTAGQVPPGTWSFTVNDWARECLSIGGCTGGSSDARYRVHVVAHPGPLASTGTLDLEVYLVTDPAGPLPNAAAAVSNPQTARWVSGISRLFAAAGICLGSVTLRDLPDWARPRYAPNGVLDVSGGGMGLPPDQVPAGCDDLSQVFTLGVAQSRAVHLFLAEELVDTSAPSLGTTLGVDGSIPGPSGFPGTVNGGAVVGIFGTFGSESAPGACGGTASAPGFACGTDLLAYVAAHEAGHWLGLYHPTEFDGVTFDPLVDTPVCPCALCAPPGQRASCAERGATNPTPVTATSCARDAPLCGGAQNLMFWQLHPSISAGQLTREQGEVMRLNPAVH